MSRGLRLDVSVSKDGFDTLGSTYRDEGLSIGADHMVMPKELFSFKS